MAKLNVKEINEASKSIQFEGKTFAKVTGPAKKGDIVFVDEASAYFGVVEEELDSDGDYYIIDGEGVGGFVGFGDVTLVAKSADRKDK